MRCVDLWQIGYGPTMEWFAWSVVGVVAWCAVALLVAVALGRAISEPRRPPYRDRAAR